MNDIQWRTTAFIRCALTLALVVPAVSACRPAPPSLVVVPLVNGPTNSEQLDRFNGSIPAAAKLYVAAVVDNRADPERGSKSVGANKEGAKPVPVQGDAVPDAFVHDAVVANLKRAGVTTTDAASATTHTLRLTLTRFWAEESPSYKGDVVVHAELLDGRGAMKWEGQLVGTSSRFGRSFSPQNYQETLSDCLVEVVAKMLGTDAFVAQLKGH